MRAAAFIALFSFFAASASAQTWRFYRNEIYGGFGASNFLGELGGNDGIGLDGFRSIKDLELALTRPVGTIGYRFRATQAIALRVAFSQGRVDGDDNRTNEFSRNNRNLHFKSPISELSLGIEIFPFSEFIGHPYRMTGTRGKKIKHLSPYIMGGISGLFFNPKAKYQRSGSWVKLHEYQNEGVDYSRITAAIVYGGGLRYSLDRQWSLGFEFGMRKTFTDYLDDVSGVYQDQTAVIANATNNGLDPNMAQWFHDPNLKMNPLGDPYFSAGQTRGDPTDLDAYMFAIFSVHYRLLKGRINLPKF